MSPAMKDMVYTAWRKAFEEGRVELDFPDEAAAWRVRAALFNATKGPNVPADVQAARIDCVLQVVGKTRLLLVRGDQARDVGMLAAALGVEVPSVDAAAEESARRFLEKQGIDSGQKLMQSVVDKAKLFTGR